MSMSPYLHSFGLSLAKRLADSEGFTLGFLRGAARHKSAVSARHSVIWHLAAESNLSLSEIGAILNKDHTSVIHAIRAENARRGTNIRDLQFPAGYHERHRVQALISKEMNREVRA